MTILRKLILALGLGMIALLFVACGESSPKDVAIAFTEDVYKGNGDKLIKYINLSKKEKEMKEVIEGKLKAAATKAERKAQESDGIEKIEVVSEDVKEEKAIIKVLVRFKNGSENDETIKLIKVDDEWKINL
ncbi:DUF4878 domain-containing protein [Helicobacter sp. MIT 21-1697]|uniref:DUF4878 domain-containing protein n=1 Tax=Helicobacter sp. MIT 21-1697 TaxID=2993733 RepID=UPI00224B5AC1|nr:DUF4878 domain-containing protein [Helicobacter sp. MIT 21-1697]MCX2716932.1 DUF4878 domain-containing protein [Helicobacter sp. MIT 21-1697]